MTYGSLMAADPTDDIIGARDNLSPETRSLILRAQAGDRAAFEQLMIFHQRLVLGTAFRILHSLEDARDAAQEVFLKLFRHLSRIRADADLRPWLYRVTVNACRDVARELYRVPLSPLVGDPTEHEAHQSAELGADDALNAMDRRRILHEAIQTLPYKEKAAVVLRDIEGLSTEQTARILGSSAATVRSQIASARIRMRRYCERSLRMKK
ncbi:MAG TPA: RNA polymerase sigma factor [Acidobacteriota bacterium]|nr:RNA polymerase sigma factor [Acidobacteriota bacterium]